MQPSGSRQADEVVDCSVHHSWDSTRELHHFMSQETRELLDASDGAVFPSLSAGFLTPPGRVESDVSPFERVRSQVLDARRVARAVLVHGKGLNLGAIRDGYFATALAHALNDWTVAQWLNRDERFVGSIAVACQLPESAAPEIARFASVDSMCQVILAGNGVGKPFGHPIYHPIYKAAAEAGKQIAIHAGASGGLNPPSSGGGSVNLFIEYHALAAQGLMTHLLSFIAHGVFDKYPELRVVLLGGGASWLPSFVWRADMDFKGVHREIPWVRRMPSDYIRENVAIGTHPLDGPSEPAKMQTLLRLVSANTRVMYGSGYPGWDEDEPDIVGEVVPQELRDSIMAANACHVYGWTTLGGVRPPVASKGEPN
jgi:uncharacterized protein